MDTTPFVKRSLRRYIWAGVIMVAVGIYTGIEARDSFHTGKPVPMGGMVSMEAWQAAGFSALVILFGGIFMAAGFGWIKSKDQH
jgi:hypothetical protein